MKRNAGKIENLQNVRIAHLILDRDAEEIEVFHGILRLQGKERNLLFFHDPVKICPRGIDPFTPDVRHAVQLFIDNLDAEMGHSDFIDIREAHRKPDRGQRLVLDDAVKFISDIACRLID